MTILKNEKSAFKHEIHLVEDPNTPLEIQGIGGIHHLALHVSDYTDLLEINEEVMDRNFNNSRLQPREFFDAIYFREPNNLLFEVASKIERVPTITDVTDLNHVNLYLPDFFENKRDSIELELKKIESYKNSN